MRVFLGLFIVSIVIPSFALNIPKKVQQEYLALGGSEKALQHTRCFLSNYADETFQIKTAQLSERCNNMASSQKQVDINNTGFVVIVDHTKKSSQRRLFVLDLESPKKPYVEKFYVAHGKYQAKTYNNTVKAPFANTVEEIDYFSNVPNSAASSSGFYITGHIYQGRWVGPKGDKFSQILHGIGKDLNDNACDRAIVLHGNGFVNESGSEEGVTRMSAGCFMVDYDVVNQIIGKIRGGGGDHHQKEKRLGGALLFSYGDSEAALPNNYYCKPESAQSLRL